MYADMLILKHPFVTFLLIFDVLPRAGVSRVAGTGSSAVHSVGNGVGGGTPGNGVWWPRRGSGGVPWPTSGYGDTAYTIVRVWDTADTTVRHVEVPVDTTVPLGEHCRHHCTAR